MSAAVLLLSSPLVLPTAGSASALIPPSPARGAAPARAAAVPVAPDAAAAPAEAPAEAPSGQAAAGTAAATDPAYPYLGYLRTTITGIAPTVVTSSTGSSITVTGTMTNTSKGTLYDLRSVWQRGAALAGVKAIKAEIAQPSAAAAVVGEDSTILGPTAPPAPGTTTPPAKQTDLAPGASSTFVASVAIGSGGLRITARGVYALTIKVTGDIGQNGETRYERVGEIHLLSTVLSVPLPALPGPATSTDTTPATTPGTTAAPAAPAAGRPNPIPVTVLWPLVDTPHLGVDRVFLDDSLARALAPGGRLFGVLSALDGFTGGPGVTLVVDPLLLDEIQLMAGGYRVIDTPGAAQAALTPTSRPTPTSSSTVAAGAAPSTAATPSSSSSSTHRPPEANQSTTPSSTAGSPTSGSGGPAPASPTTSTDTGPPAAPAGTVAGTGQAAAAAFLTRLRAAAHTHQVLALPYSDPDSVAMMRAGLDDQLAALVTTGAATAQRVLQLEPGDPRLTTDTLIPAGGSVNDATLAFLSGHGIAHAVLSPATVQHAEGAVGAVTIDERPDQGALVTTALTDADVLAQVADVVAKGREAGLPTRLTTAAALLAGGSLDGTGTPLVILPDKLWTANAAGLSVLDDLLQTLRTGRVLAVRPLAAVTSNAAVPATLAYPAAAETAELPAGYLARVVADNSSITAVGGSLIGARTAGAAVPTDLLNPLRTALSTLGAASLRTRPEYGFRILQTVGDTLDRLRGGVSIASQSPSTLAASTAPLLITVRNDLPYGVRVKVVVVDGESVGMTTKDPELEEIPEGGSHQFRIDARVVKAGRFQVHAQIQAADGSMWSAPTTITVSSSAYGALTIVLIAVAGAALTLMVALRLIQRVRNRNRSAGGTGDARADGPRAGGGPAGQLGRSGSRQAPDPDSILAAANESGRPASSDPPSTDPPSSNPPSSDPPSSDPPITDPPITDPPSNPTAHGASVAQHSPPRAAPYEQQGDVPR